MSKAKMELIRKFAAEQGIEIVDIKVKKITAKSVAGHPKMVERRSAFNGAKFIEAEDTPFACSPRSEHYWCS